MKDEADSSMRAENEDLLFGVITNVIARRAKGETLSDEQVIAEHPSLMPRIRERLVALNRIHKTVMLARDGSPTDSDSVILSESRLDDPISPEEYGNDLRTSRELRIRGFQIVREISSGGQATVYQAIQERTGRTVAIKVVHGGPFAGSRHRARFDRESVILAKLNHPNVVSILDKGRTSDGSFYLVMEFIEGINLDGFLCRLRGNTPAIVRMFVKIANAVEEAHRYGVVHRDLKPMNIRIDNRGEPHILDFGMARVIERDEGQEDLHSLTRTGQVLGSLLWSSPEQVMASQAGVDARSDVYSLGVMLYKALAGEFPYPINGGLHEIIKYISNRSPAPLIPAALRNKTIVAKPLEYVVAKTLQKAPNRRYASAGLLARELEISLSAKSPLLQIDIGRILFSFIILLMVAFIAVLKGSSPSVNVPSADRLSPAEVPSFFNSFDMKFAKIPAGEIAVDLPNGNTVKNDDSRVQIYRAIKPFAISVTPVTRESYLKVTGKHPDDSHMLNMDFPVTNVTWKDACEFCQRLSGRDGHRYRLPDVNEWEYAFCAADPLTYRDLNLDSIAWYAENSSQGLHSVALKKPNPSGLFDMLGDVRQWCSNPVTSANKSLASPDTTEQVCHVAEGIDYSMQPINPHAPSQSILKSETALPTVGFRIVCEDADK